MNNTDVGNMIAQCDIELAHIQTLISSFGATSLVVPYLTKYAAVRACGCIETSFKAVIADYCSLRSKKQVKRFINRRVRDGSANPNINNIHKFLLDFDPSWHTQFKVNLKAEPNSANLLTSLQSLVDARNEFSHGGNPTLSLADIVTYFAHAKRIIEIMDTVVV